MRHEAADAHIHIRAKPSDRALLDRAAGLAGLNRSQYVMSVAVEKAKNDILDQNVIRMSERAFDEFVHWLDSPKSDEELAGVRRLMSLRAPWD
jgi:uncharacterized protein (DUF1778 family)